MQTAVLVVSYNRPALTSLVLEAVAQAKPSRLYFAVDGPRRREDEDLCAQTRDLVQGVNWECDVHTLFHELNLGAGGGVKTAIDWVLSDEEEVIILEDDCVPDATFFRFCSELLAKYKDNQRVMSINGSSVRCATRQLRRRGHSYEFSRYSLPWGWATWRSAWDHFDFEMERWPEIKESGQLRSLTGGDRRFETYWNEKLQSAYVELVDAWDYQWRLSMWLHDGLAVLPQANMIANRGFGPGATHTKNRKDPRARRVLQPTAFPLRHPEKIVRSNQLDLCLEREWFGLRGLWPTFKGAVRNLDERVLSGKLRETWRSIQA